MNTDLGAIDKGPEAQAELLDEFYDTAFRTDNVQRVPTLPFPSVMMIQEIATPPRGVTPIEFRSAFIRAITMTFRLQR